MRVAAPSQYTLVLLTVTSATRLRVLGSLNSTVCKLAVVTAVGVAVAIALAVVAALVLVALAVVVVAWLLQVFCRDAAAAAAAAVVTASAMFICLSRIVLQHLHYIQLSH
jgi:hypothetical protein